MYAVVKTGGKQVKLETGMTEVVEKLDVPVGGTITFAPIFVSDDGNALVGGDVAGVTVTAEVIEHFKGDKQLVFKFKKRKGYKKLKGHRQDQTRIRVTGISLAGEAPKKPAVKKAAEKPAAETAPKAEKAEKAAPVVAAEAVVETPAAKPVKKPAAKKPAAPKAVKAEGETAEKKPAAKKPAAKKPAAKKETPADESAE